MTEYRNDIEEIEEDDERTFGEWLQDNLRVIISVIIVLLLALGIYSYSKRTQEARIAAAPTEQASPANDGGVMAKIGDAVKDGAAKAADTAKDGAAKVADGAKDAAATATEAAARAKDAAKATVAAADDAMHARTAQATATAQDKATGEGITTVARRGDGKTHLARRALAAYMARHNVDGLSGAHKVYIEDYLQKAVGGSRTVRIGQELHFSNALIAQAIERAKTLTDAQLRHLQKYANAASLS